MDPPAWTSAEEFQYRHADETNRARSPGSSDEAELRDSQPRISQGEATVANATGQQDGVNERDIGPEYKDQVRRAGGDAVAQADVVVAQQADSIVPLAESVHVVVEEDAPADPPTLPAVAHILEQDSEEDEQILEEDSEDEQILEEDSEDEQILEEDLQKAAMKMHPSGINAKNTVGTIKCKAGAAKRPVSMPRNNSSAANNSPPIAPTKTPPRVARRSSNNLNSLPSDSPQAAPEITAARQPKVHRKRKIWAASLVLGIVAVIVLVAVVLVNTGGGDKSSTEEMESQTEEIKLPSQSPTQEIKSQTTESPTQETNEYTLPTKEIKLNVGISLNQFGNSVAIDEGTIVIGAFKDTTADGEDIGSAYVYILSGSVWTQQAKLIVGKNTDDFFGRSVAINRDTIVIGAFGDGKENDSNTGSAYVYTRSGTVWTEQAKLTASDGAAEDQFGYSVAADGGTIVIGARADDTENGENSGSAYVYTRSGSVWTEQAKLIASDSAAGDVFGNTVAIDRDTIVIGAVFDNDNGNDSGSAYVYTFSGSVWTEQTKLTASDGSASDFFGGSVAIDGNTMVIGAPHDINSSRTGGAYVFTFLNTAVWTEQVKLTASDTVAGDQFGWKVAMDGDTIIIGANYDETENGIASGSAYVYTHSGTFWTEQAKLTASDGFAEDYFGTSVALEGDTIVIGAPYDSTEYALKAGSVYIFE